MAKKIGLRKALGLIRGCVKKKSVKGKAGVASCAGKQLRKHATKRRKPRRVTSGMRKARSDFKKCVKQCKGGRGAFFRGCMKRCVRQKARSRKK